MWTYEVPKSVFEKLIGGFVAETARDVLDLRQRGGPTVVLHPGDPYGQVLAWLWRTAPDEAVACVADLLAQVRYHSRGSDPSITLDELVDGIRSATHDMPADEAEALLAAARDGVPPYFDADVTSRPGEG